jgi:hypothetical protein
MDSNFNDKKSEEQFMYDIIVIGAGFSGAYAALRLSQRGYNVLVLEKGDGVIGSQSTSFNQCYKLHSGVHYFGDAITARKCLIDSITYAKDCAPYLLGNSGSKARRNRHYIMSNSLFNVEEARKVANMLKKTYKDFVQNDPANQVFGDPDNFIMEINPEQCPYIAKEMEFITKTGEKEKAKVELAFDVGEPQVDIYRIKEYLQQELTRGNGLSSLFNCEVKRIEPLTNGLGYKIVAVNRNSNASNLVEFAAKGIVNCAWQNIEEIDETAGFMREESDRLLIRTKISLLVKLPFDLLKMETCIFSLGPYCSITNLFDGTAVLTYEPITNVGHYFYGENPPENIRQIEKLGLGLTNSILGKKLADDIINGCSIYVPKMKDAELLEVRAGYVKMYLNRGENYSIYERVSPIHKRREDGIVLHKSDLISCYISASGIKMTYTESNAKKICDLMQIEMQKRNELEHRMSLLYLDKNDEKIKLLKKDLIVMQFLAKKMLDISPDFFKIFFEQMLLRKIIENTDDNHLNSKDDLQKSKEFINETEKVFALANGIDTKPLLPTLFKDPISSDFYLSA